MKITILKNKKDVPRLKDVPFGDLFVLMDDNDVYLKCGTLYSGLYHCHSLRDGSSADFEQNVPVRIVHSVEILADDYPKNYK